MELEGNRKVPNIRFMEKVRQDMLVLRVQEEDAEGRQRWK